MSVGFAPADVSAGFVESPAGGAVLVDADGVGSGCVGATCSALSTTGQLSTSSVATAELSGSKVTSDAWSQIVLPVSPGSRTPTDAESALLAIARMRVPARILLTTG